MTCSRYKGCKFFLVFNIYYHNFSLKPSRESNWPWSHTLEPIKPTLFIQTMFKLTQQYLEMANYKLMLIIFSYTEKTKKLIMYSKQWHNSIHIRYSCFISYWLCDLCFLLHFKKKKKNKKQKRSAFKLLYGNHLLQVCKKNILKSVFKENNLIKLFRRWDLPPNIAALRDQSNPNHLIFSYSKNTLKKKKMVAFYNVATRRNWM